MAFSQKCRALQFGCSTLLSVPPALVNTTMKLAVAALLAGSAAAFAPSTLVGRSATQLDARKPFISGNWKLNPQTRDEAVKLAGDIAASITDASPEADVALFVPYVFLEAAMGAAGDKLMVGAEVCFFFENDVSLYLSSTAT